MRFELGLSVITMLLFGSAAADVHFTADLGGDAVRQDFHNGDVVPIEFDLAQNGDTPLFGGEFSIAVASDGLRIHSVTFNPAFSRVLGQESALPNSSYTTSRIQPLGAINRSLGTNRTPVHFATVELEVLSDYPFESALIVKARGALVGKLPESTIVLGNPSGPDGWAEGRIEIVNIGTAEDSSPESLDSWTVDEASADFEIRPVGGRSSVSVVAPNTAYEVHYTADRSVNGFDLLVTTESFDAESAAPEFESCWEGAEVADLPPADGDPESQRQVVSADLGVGAGDSGPGAGDSGLLCHFVTGAHSAPYRFDLRLYNTDPETHTVVEMPANAEFEVTGTADER